MVIRRKFSKNIFIAVKQYYLHVNRYNYPRSYENFNLGYQNEILKAIYKHSNIETFTNPKFGIRRCPKNIRDIIMNVLYNIMPDKKISLDKIIRLRNQYFAKEREFYISDNILFFWLRFINTGNYVFLHLCTWYIYSYIYFKKGISIDIYDKHYAQRLESVTVLFAEFVYIFKNYRNYMYVPEIKLFTGLNNMSSEQVKKLLQVELANNAKIRKEKEIREKEFPLKKE